MGPRGVHLRRHVQRTSAKQGAQGAAETAFVLGVPQPLDDGLNDPRAVSATD
jgi:hypothetical protein